jgi:hypothetical protein
MREMLNALPDSATGVPRIITDAVIASGHFLSGEISIQKMESEFLPAREFCKNQIKKKEYESL